MQSIAHRRRFLKTSVALVATSLLPAVPGASAAKVAPHDVSRLYRSAIVIDGNLVPPIDPDAPLDAATAKAIRSSD